jgi:hypothetical protein
MSRSRLEKRSVKKELSNDFIDKLKVQVEPDKRLNPKLKELSKNANVQLEKKTLLEMPVKHIFDKLHSVIFNILDDILELKSIQDLPEIFLKGNRLFYIGLYLIIVYVIYTIFYVNISDEK